MGPIVLDYEIDPSSLVFYVLFPRTFEVSIIDIFIESTTLVVYRLEFPNLDGSKYWVFEVGLIW